MRRLTDQSQTTAGLLTLSQVIAAGSAFLINLVAAYVMQPSERGILAFGLQIAYTITVLTLIGAERPFLAARDGPFGQQYLDFLSVIRPGLIGTIIAGIAGTIAIALWQPMSTYLALVVSIYILLNALSLSVRVAYISSGTWQPFMANSLGSQAVLLAGAALLGWRGADSAEAWITLYAISGLVPLVILVAVSRRPYAVSGIIREDRRELRLRGLELLPAAFGNTAMARSDRLLLPILASTADLGRYVVVATIMEMAAWPTTQWVDASLRRWQTDEHDSGRTHRIMLRTLVVITILAILLGLAGYLVIDFFLPPEYEEGITVIIPLGIASVIYGLTRVQQGLLIARGRGGLVSIVEITGLIVSIVAYLLLIPFMGILGAAIGSIIGFISCLVLGAWFLAKKSATE